MATENILTGKTATYFTLGCKLNFAETASIGQKLAEFGVRKAAKGERADICIVNTCSVTEVADHKCRQAIHRLVKQNPGALVVVTGCYAELKPQEIKATPGVSLVIGTKEKGSIISLILEKMATQDSPGFPETPELAKNLTNPGNPGFQEKPDSPENQNFFPSCSRGDRTRYFLKVQDGCNYFCTYCTIPLARGRSRNGSIPSLVAQAKGVAAEGGKEIVLTGVNIGDFGRSTGETFLDLIRALDQVEGIERYRISSIEPNLLTEEIIDFCAASQRFMPHFHIPLQSGSDRVLRLMHRHYDTALFRSRIEYIKRMIPDAFIGVDVIVGTRGETEELFEESLQFIDSLPISQLHVFSYSERPGTKALEIPHIVTPQEKHQRSQQLIALSEQKLRKFYTSQIGTVRPVLFEHAPKGKPMHGFTDNYIRVETQNDSNLDNKIVNIRLAEYNSEEDALKVAAFLQL